MVQCLLLEPECAVLCCAKPPQSCLSLCDPMDSSPPGSSVHAFAWIIVVGGERQMGVGVKAPRQFHGTGQ